MAPRTAPARPSWHRENFVLLPIKLHPDLRKRFKIAAVETDKSYGALLEHLLDERDAKLERQRRAQAHPLHQPDTSPRSIYPGGGTP